MTDVWTFPLRRDSKEPACEWREPENQRLWKMGDHVGIDCGRSGLVVIDCDIDKTTREMSGWKEFACLCEDNDDFGALDTFAVMTPSGGTHFFYLAREGYDIHNSAGRTRKSPRMPHVDVRGNGGFVVAPGAMGGRYEIVRRDKPVLMPEWLCEALNKPPEPEIQPGAVPASFGHSYAEKALEGEVRALFEASLGGPGGRNDQLNRSAFNLGTLVQAGALDPSRAEEVLLATATAVGLTYKEARKTILSGLLKGARAHPRIQKEKD